MTKVGVTGHQNLPAKSIPFIRKEISRALSSIDDTIVGISSLAVGADQLFAEALLKAKENLYVIIPCKGYENTFKDISAIEKYFKFLGKAEFSEILPFEEPSEEAFLQAGKRIVDLSDILIAIWDGEKPKGKGGTSDIVEYARAGDMHVIIIWPKGVSR